jgi:hypothetical protein
VHEKNEKNNSWAWKINMQAQMKENKHEGAKEGKATCWQKRRKINTLEKKEKI